MLSPAVSPVEVVVSVSPPAPPAEGSSVTLTCNSSECNPPVQSYTWFRGGQQGQHTLIASGQTLTFNLSSSDEGLYYCRAEHPQGGKESAAVRLVIKEDKRDFFLTIGLSGGSLAIVVLMAALIICAKRHNKSTSTEEQTSESETSATCDKEGPAPTNGPKPSEEQVEIHYGEIDFSKLPLRDTSEGQKQGPGQETEYAEVHLSSRDATATGQTGPDKEELYAKVQK
ncbi:B-cell receptor CD22-like [Sardina pilchardus]|uniref:B-cell receptor CD22-like n=1 Tax=Sardina pilchardus TaxID=27697 RepID=UPI002E0D6A63